MRRRPQYPEILAAVSAVVRDATAETPVRRADLVRRVVAQLEPLYPSWRVTTWMRRVREITESLEKGSPPLVNAGKGFYFARTVAEARAGVRRKRWAAFCMLKSTAAVLKCGVLEAARQLELEFGSSDPKDGDGGRRSGTSPQNAR